MTHFSTFYQLILNNVAQLKPSRIFIMSYLSVFVSIKIHISCDVINCINSGSKSFDLIPQTYKQIHFISEKNKFLFFKPWCIFISRSSCLPVLLIGVFRVSRRGKRSAYVVPGFQVEESASWVRLGVVCTQHHLCIAYHN